MVVDHTIGALDLSCAILLRIRCATLRNISSHEQIPVAEAGYWGAYAISFIAREQVRVASSDVVRIQEYQKRFFDRSSEAVLISDRACPGGERVARWYLCKP